MAQSKDHIKASYPIPVYNYRVSILEPDGGEAESIGFSEVSGLSVNFEPVTYKHGLSSFAGYNIIPGMRQPVNVTMKRGVVNGGDYLHAWFEKAHRDPPFESVKRDIVVDLCDEKGTAIVRWRVLGALPTSLSAPTFDASSNDVAIESLEVIANDLKVDFSP